ncbi:MAG TPA: hypothetical protein VH639_20100 [Bryobacteraceae bacterium]
MKRVLPSSAWSFGAAAALAFAGAAIAQTVTLPPPSSLSSGTSSYGGTTIAAAGSAGAVTINGTANVTFTATSQITLLPGFHATASGGALFKALIQSVQITLTTAPSGLWLTADGNACVAPCVFQWAPGSNHTIAATPSPQSGGSGIQYAYSSWSDGGGQTHQIVTPASASTYTASYATQYFLTTGVSPSAGGSIGPSGGWYGSGAQVGLSETPNSGYTFSGYTNVGGSLNGSTITMSGAATATANFTGGGSGPLTLPSPLKGVTYFPRGHAWWSMLNDYYTQDCSTSTLPQNCTPNTYVYQIVQNDLAMQRMVSTSSTSTSGIKTSRSKAARSWDSPRRAVVSDLRTWFRRDAPMRDLLGGTTAVR